MNKKIKLRLSFLLVVFLLVLCAPSAFAEASYFPVSEDALITLSSKISDYDPEETDPDTELPVCDFEILRHSGELITKDEVSDPLLFRSLLSSGTELRITPPAGYYVTALTLTNDSGFSPSEDNLLTCAYAQDIGTAISLNFGEIASDNGTEVEVSYVSAFEEGHNYGLEVTIEPLLTDTPVAEYSAGDFDYDGQLVEGGDTVEGWALTIKPLLPEVLNSASEENLRFSGYHLIYENGSHIDLKPDSEVSLYMDAVIEAQWTVVTPPPDPDPEPDPDPDPDPEQDEPTFPTLTIKASDLSKVYDGTPLEASYQVIGETNGYSVRNVTVEGSIIKAGTATSRIISYELYDPDNNRVSEEEIAYEGCIEVQDGTLTVSQRPLKVTAISGQINTNGEDIYASDLNYEDGGFHNGYKAEGLLAGHNLSGNFVTGHGTDTFKTDIDKDSLQVLDRSGFDVTSNYALTTVPGEITIRKNQLLNIPLTITTKSKAWTYDGKEHKLNEFDVTGLVDGDKVINVKFNPSSVITNVGEQDNDIVSVEIVSADGKSVPDNKYKAQKVVGKLSVVEREITITAITGSITADGEEKFASRLSSPDGTFTNGYKVEGLIKGHRLSGDFVTGSGKTSFNTDINLDRLSILDRDGNNVTRNYKIKTISGRITINAPAVTNVSVIVTAKSAQFTYDGNEHSLNEYEVTGLIDGDQIDKVIFKSTSVITNVGVQANEIQSVVIKSSSGAAISNGKYSIRYIPGTLEVTKFPLTLTAVSDSKTYDGKALNNKNVKASALANANHKLSADYDVYDSNGNSIKNGPVDVGVYTKKVSNVKIISGNQDVTANYDIKTVDGTLTITDSSGSTYSTASSTANAAYYGSTFTIRSDAPYSEFQYLLIDGQKIASSNYTVKEGSTVITMKASYIQTLKSGKHNYSIVSTSKIVDGSFTVGKAPRTGDNSRAVIWVLLLVITALLASAAAYYIIRRNKSVTRKNLNEEYPVTEAPEPPAPAKRILDVDPMLDQDDDPTLALMKDFELDLDEFRPGPPSADGNSSLNPVSSNTPDDMQRTPPEPADDAKPQDSTFSEE